MADSPDNQAAGLIYDLRQHYANLVGEHLQDVAEARKADKYSAWLENLQDVYTIIHHKIKDEKEAEKQYNQKINEIATISQKHRSTWSGSNQDDKSTAEIKHVLRDLEMWIYKEMEKAKMFGTHDFNEDDE